MAQHRWRYQKGPSGANRPGPVDILLTAVRGRTPSVWGVVIEKNGKEMTLRPGEVFPVIYRDEFVVKEIISDALFTGRVSARIEGGETPIGMKTLVKGISLVDRVMEAESAGRQQKERPVYRLVVQYEKKKIAELPLHVEVTPQDWLRVAKESHNGGSLQIASLKKALEMNPQDIEVRRLLAAAYAGKGRTDEAIATYRQILKEKPGDIRSMVEASKLLLDANRYEEALGLYRRIIAANPKDGGAMANAGLAAAKLNRWKEAVQYYGGALKINPGNAAIMVRLAEALEKDGKPDQAAAQYQAYLKGHGDDLDTLAALGNIYLKGKRFDEALRVFSGIVRQRPDDAGAHARLGLVYEAKGKNSDAIDSYQKSLSIKPDEPVVRYNLAVALVRAKRYADAMAEYDRVLKLAPDDVDALIDLAGLCAQEKKYPRAVLLYEKALKKGASMSKDRKAAVYAGLGYAWGELKEYSKSASNYEKAVALGAKDATVLKNLKTAREKSGSAKKETADTSPAVMDKSSQKAFSLAEGYVKQKKYDKAVKVYEQMTGKGSVRAQAYTGLGRVYGLQGKGVKEIESYRSALKYDRGNDDIWYALGAACERQGLYAEALEAYSAAYERNPDSKAGEKIPALKIRMIQQKYDKKLVPEKK